MSAPTEAKAAGGRRAARRAETMDEIVVAAWDLVREQGLAGLNMRDLGKRVGMKAQSLYSYFASKNEIYDAMFHQGYLAFIEAIGEVADLPADELRALGGEGVRRTAHLFFDFCTSDPVRYQLLFQRTIPDFVPSDESYAVALRALEATAEGMATLGIDDPVALDLWTAVLTGLTDQQISNDPGGDRWNRVVDRAVDMFLAANAPHLLQPNEMTNRPPEGNPS